MLCGTEKKKPTHQIHSFLWCGDWCPGSGVFISVMILYLFQLLGAYLGDTLPALFAALETFYRFLCLCCRGYQQQDAHEFMRYLLDKLHTELAQSRTSEQAKNTIVSDIFGGVLQSDVSYQWPSCGLVGKGSSKAFLLFGKGSL